jgi:tRNA threonylcarbamoyladenosine biosynthesis protein TsaB
VTTKFPLVLAVETTSSTGSLCIAEINGASATILAAERWQKKSTHSEVITNQLLSALKYAEIELSDLTHLAIDVGPGSFTGIRVGLNLIRTLAYSLDLPTRSITSLELFAFQALSPGDSAVIAIPAIQGYFYAACFARRKDGVEMLSPAESLDKAGIEKLMAKTKVEKLAFPNEEPKAESIIQLLMSDFKKANFLQWKDVLPLYIRASEAEEKLRKGLLKPIT